MKRKFIGFIVLAALVVGLAAPPASGFTFPVGDSLGTQSDYASFYDDQDNALPAPTWDDSTSQPIGINVGDRQAVIFKIKELYEPPVDDAGNRYFDGTSTELVGMIYDLAIVDARVVSKTQVDIYLGDAGVYGGPYSGGRLDLWDDPDLDYDPAGNGGYPNDWEFNDDTLGAQAGETNWYDYPFDVSGGSKEYDFFPTVAEGTPIVSGTLTQAGTSPTDAAIGSVPYNIHIALNFDSFHGVADTFYVDVLYSTAGIFKEGRFPGGAEISISNELDWWNSNVWAQYEGGSDRGQYLDDPTTTDPVYWAASSNDDMQFSIIPEPATMSLLGMGLVGLVGAAWRRRKNG